MLNENTYRFRVEGNADEITLASLEDKLANEIGRFILEEGKKGNLGYSMETRDLLGNTCLDIQFSILDNDVFTELSGFVQGLSFKSELICNKLKKNKDKIDFTKVSIQDGY